MAPRAPENLWSGGLSLSYDNYNTLETELFGGGALVKDKFFLRLAGRYMGSDGYFTNTVDNDDEVDEKKNYDGRISLRYTPSEKLTADLKSNLQKYDSNYSEFTTFDKTQDSDFDVSVNDPGHVDKDFSNVSLKVAFDMENVRLTSITTALNSDTTNGNDSDTGCSFPSVLLHPFFRRMPPPGIPAIGPVGIKLEIFFCYEKDPLPLLIKSSMSMMIESNCTYLPWDSSEFDIYGNK